MKDAGVGTSIIENGNVFPAPRRSGVGPGHPRSRSRHCGWRHPTIRVEGQPQMRVRLSAIDAPEKAHAFGQRAKQAQSDVCFGEDAALEVVDTDRYGRTVAEVWCGEVNANRAMIENGFAWVYRKYAEGRVDLMAAEVDARNARRGLWADQSPVPPWEFRRTKPPAR